ncbi:hypothetical protein DY000_02038284 [Brassica cretica]|uniref:Uncharacterized protein n=1 Tax=Brassica cretica TaxID=69181 RepID=A0ABQ7BP46_BRACR|nr:hypothetical protein DY000_02038284 [Brassica cretica]
MHRRCYEPETEVLRTRDGGGGRCGSEQGDLRRGNEEAEARRRGSTQRSARREDGRNGVSEAIPSKEVREEGEIKSTGENDTLLPSIEFLLGLAKTQAESTKVVVESTDEDKGLQMVRGLVEQWDDQEDEFDMEMDVINATLAEGGVDMEAEEEFETLSEEEADHASRAQEELVRIQREEEVVSGKADIEIGTGEGDLTLKQVSRKRLFKPSISTKMRMASALVSPRRKAAGKVGHHGEGSKPPERKGPSNPKPVNLKF